MEIERLAIPEVILVRPARHGDARGFFSEVWHAERFAAAGITARFVQDNHSRSAAAGVLRGLHFQIPPAQQAKLVRVVRGRIFDVAVDLRRGAPSYGTWVGAELSAENWTQIFVPRGFAHGFLTLEPETEVIYKVDAPYAPDCDRGLAWDDPDLAIDWPLAGLGPPQLSAKDAAQARFAGFESPFAVEVPR